MVNDADPIEFESLPTRADCRALYRWIFFNYSRRAWGFLPFSSAMAVALAVPAIATFVSYGVSTIPIFAEVALVVAFALVAWIGYSWYATTIRSPNRYYDGLVKYGPIGYRFTEAGVTTRSALRRAEYDWDRLACRIELPTLDVFVVGDAASFFVTAKRDVPASDRERFDRLISRLRLGRTMK